MCECKKENPQSLRGVYEVVASVYGGKLPGV